MRPKVPQTHFPKVYSIPSSANNTSKSKDCWRTSALAPRAAPSHIPIILQNSLHAHSHTHQPSTSHPPEAQPDLGRVPTAPCVRPPPPSTAQHSRTQGTDGCSSRQQGSVFIDSSFSPNTHRAAPHPIETAGKARQRRCLLWDRPFAAYRMVQSLDNSCVSSSSISRV